MACSCAKLTPLAPAPPTPSVSRVTAVGEGWVELDRELPFDLTPALEAELHAYAPSLQKAGVERLTLAFAPSK